MARTYPRASVCTGQAYWHLIWRRQYSASGISAVNRIAAACVMMFFDTAIWGVEAVTEVTIAAQFNQQDLIFGIVKQNTLEERTSEREFGDCVFRD
jgi:hypothetical protein